MTLPTTRSRPREAKLFRNNRSQAVRIPADIEYGKLRVELETAGQPIGGNDLLIATHARARGMTLVTGNTGEFGCVRGLAVENWLT